MLPFPRSPSGQGSIQFPQSFNYQPTPSSSAYQHNGFYNQGPPYPLNPQSLDPKTPTTPPNSELTTLSLKPPSCPFCKGQKYGFTAYFHNRNIFPEPPHELLPFVETSYVLKNRLQSLLVTYVMRVLEDGGFHGADRDVQCWSQGVEDLLRDIVASVVGFELGPRPLEDVRSWTGEMTRRIRESLAGTKKLELPKGRLVSLLLEFRELWEALWKQYLLDRKQFQ